MKIFIISKYASTPRRGSTNRQFGLAKYLNRISEKTTLIYSRSNGLKYPRSLKLSNKEIVEDTECVRINGVTISEMGINFKRMFSWIQFEINLFFYFLFLPKKKRPDVVFVSSFSLFSFYTIGVLKRIYGFRMVTDVRDICPKTELDFGRIKENGLIHKVFKFIELYGYKKADLITASMPKFDEYLKTQNITGKPFLCIPQGFDKEKIDIRNNQSSSDSLFSVIHAGTIGEVNLVEELCDAAKFLQEENIKFLIYGDGPLKEELIQKYGHLKNLHFMGVVSRSEIIEIMEKSSLMVNMWADKEVYDYGVSPNKWIDYMLAAKPILVSYNGYRSIINEANCGWFIQANNPHLMADKILEISRMDKESLDRIGLNGREHLLKNHAFNILAKRLKEFILINN